MSIGSANSSGQVWARISALAAALLVIGAVFATTSASAAKPQHPNLKGPDAGVAESIAAKITDPSFTKLIFNLIKEDTAGPSIGDVLRELAVINAKLDVLDRKVDEIAAQVAEIRTSQYWIELQKYISAVAYVQEQLADIGKERDFEDRQARSRVLARFIQENLAPYRKSFQNFVMTVPGGRKGIIAALSDQQKLGIRFWGQKETDNLTEAYNYYAAYQALLAAEVAQAKIALAASPGQKEKAEEDAKDIGLEAREAIAKQRAELPKGLTGGWSWNVDVQSRLIWVTRPGAAPVGWSQAVNEVAQSKLGGFSNWRLPSDPDYDALGPGCLHRNYREPCAFATVIAKRGWKLGTSCSGRNVWWTTTPQAGQAVGLIWTDMPPMTGQVAYNPGTACVFQIRGAGDGERYWM